MASFSGRGTRKSPMGNDLAMRVEIKSAVIDRIKASIMGSQVEEGGKFLGTISDDPSGTTLHIETFLDSGPGVDKSSGHILPDGEYQESLFRLLEIWDPAIEHLGTWHSHHCNGLDALSEGDIRGYVDSVNDCRYTPRYFFVMLVVNMTDNSIQCRFYLFEKGTDQYFELPPERVRERPGAYRLDAVLCDAEKISESMSRGQRIDDSLPLRRDADVDPNQAPMSTETPDGLLLLRHFRKADDAWFRSFFDKVDVKQSRDTRRLAWIAEKRVGHTQVTVRYIHPAEVQHGSFAEVDVLVDGKDCGPRQSVPLDPARFQRLMDIVAAAAPKPKRPHKRHKQSRREPTKRSEDRPGRYTRKGGVELDGS